MGFRLHSEPRLARDLAGRLVQGAPPFWGLQALDGFPVIRVTFWRPGSGRAATILHGRGRLRSVLVPGLSGSVLALHPVGLLGDRVADVPRP